MGESGSGKTETFKAILQHMIDHSGETREEEKEKSHAMHRQPTTHFYYNACMHAYKQYTRMLYTSVLLLSSFVHFSRLYVLIYIYVSMFK